jgi:hypothetical protein
MSYEIKENSGSAFENDRKRPGMKDADWTGKINVDGRIYWLNIWNNTAKSGSPYLGVKVSPHTARERSEPTRVVATKPEPATEDFNDDIPF